MDGSGSPFRDLSFIAVLVLANAVFVAAEYALVRCNPLHIRNPDSRKRPGNRAATALLDELDLSLSAIQLGIAICAILMGWWGQETLFNVFNSLAGYFGETLDPTFSRPTAIILSLLLVVYLHVVIGELVPQSVAVRHPDGAIRFLAGFILIVRFLLRPLVYVLEKSAAVVLRLFGMSRIPATGRVLSLAELSFLVSRGPEGSGLDKEEQEMLRGVFGLSDTVAREIMTPRTDLVTIDADADFEHVLSVIRDSGLSRFPVVGESVDDVVGIILSRDVLSFVVPNLLKQGLGVIEGFDVRRLMREAYFIPGTKAIDDLLGEFKRRKLHLAIVLDEHGGVDGVVTLEDLIEEIVGDIFDESDVPESSVTIEENGDVVVDGGQLVADINNKFALHIPEGAYDTIAGFIFTSLGRMPRPGDSILVNVANLGTGSAVPEMKSEVEAEAADAAEESSKDVNGKEEIPLALITVEKVQSYRIESVRIRRCSSEEIISGNVIDRSGRTASQEEISRKIATS